MSCKYCKGNLLKEDDRYYLDLPEHNNCYLCLINEKGALTQEEIANYLGITKMRVCQIQKESMKKLDEKVKKFYD